MTTQSARTAFRGALLSLLLLAVLSPGARAQSTDAVDIVWEATSANFGGRMMDIDRFENSYSVGDTYVNGVVLTRKFSSAGILLWERSFRPEVQVRATWVAADPNGGAYVVGFKWITSDQYPVGYFVLRYDGDGNLVFSDIVDGSAAQAVRAEADHAGNAYVTGGLYDAGVFRIGIVKYTSAGRQWVCPVANPNGTGFPGTPLPTGLFVSDNDSWIAASGTSGYNFYVLSCDPSGFKRWQDFRDVSVYAAAVAVSNAGEVYFGNGLAGGAGMQLRKYSPTGVLQWTNVYSPGDYIHRLALDSLGNVIAIGPDYGTSYYANWVTMKVAPNGTQLWSRIFDGLDGNNEIPNFVAVDPFDNVYVTGTGGPAVIAANGSQYLRMVTLKYSAAGAPQWTIGSADGFSGNAVRVGDDGVSLFVQGYGQMYTARYRQTGLGDAPAAPTALSASAVFSGFSYKATLAWTDNASNELWYDIYRCSGAGCTAYAKIGRTLAADATSFDDFAVLEGSVYGYRVVAHGFSADSAPSSGAQVAVGAVAVAAASGTTSTSITPVVAAAPAAPVNLAATAFSSSQIALLWTDKSTDQTLVAIERCASPCSRFGEIARVAGSATSFSDSGLAARKSYSYRVRAYNGAGWSPYSATATAKTLR
ncbi:MAG: fibronectin type III domain-containing protein [Burkholderiales bacterium]